MTPSNLGPLADDYAVIKDQIDRLTERLDAIKATVKEAGVDVIEGDVATLKVSLAERATLDAKAVRALLTDAQYAACSKTTVYPVIRCVRNVTCV